MSEAKHYRCKHNIEVMRWVPETYKAFAAWFFSHGQAITTKDNVVVLPDDLGEVQPGELVAWSLGEFIVMTQDQIDEDYEEIK